MDEMTDIIEKKIPVDQVTKMYNNGELKENECKLLYATQRINLLKRYLTGELEFKFYHDSTVNPKTYFTNIPVMLNAFYTLFERFPEYHFDKLLERGLIELSKSKNFIFYYKFIVKTNIGI